MAAVQPAAPAGADGEGQQQQAGMGQIVNMVARAGLMYAFMMWMRSGKSGGESAVPLVGPDPAGRRTVVPMFPPGELFDVNIYLSYSHRPKGKLLWSVEQVPLSQKGFRMQQSVNLTADDFSEVINTNRTPHVVTQLSVPEKSTNPEHVPSLFSYSIPLVKFRPPKQAQEGRSLLGGETRTTDAHEGQESVDPGAASSRDGSVEDDAPSDTDGPVLWVPYFKPNLTISMVDMFQQQNANRLPPNMAQALKVTRDDKYLPLLHLNDFWVLEDYMIPVNETTGSLELQLELNTASNMYWMLISTFEIAIETNRQNGMAREMEELKRVFLEGNPYFLFLTFVVSLLHSVFDMLAFKNDIGFWRSNKSMEGLSAKSVIINAFCQAVIFLYLLDNETSTVVLLSAGIGVLIEFWKITRVMDVSVEAIPGQMPRLKIAHRASYVESETKKHDDNATKYMSYALFPLIIGYFVYSLVYDKHKSWMDHFAAVLLGIELSVLRTAHGSRQKIRYSFVLQSLVGCVYAFGFVLMCPQLYLNYKLKSVAHLPWRQMTYKFLNTIVDDLGAFIIKMPLLHRLAVFRDDVVFLIFLYQRWIYRVDKNRVNEFGFTGDDAQKPEEVEGPQGASTLAIEDQPSGTSAAAASATTATQRRGKATEVHTSKPSTEAEDAKEK